MKKFKVGDIISFRNWGLFVKGIGEIVETDSGVVHNEYLVKLQGECKGKGHNGNGLCKKTGGYATNDYWYVRQDEPTIKLIQSQSESIHITRKGDIVHDVLKNGEDVVKRAKAVCSPADTFDFNVGAKLAMERLLGEERAEEQKEEFPKYVQVVKEDPLSSLEVGDIAEVIGNFDADIFLVKRLLDGEEHVAYEDCVKPLKAVQRNAKVGEYIMLTSARYSFNKKGETLKVSEVHGDLLNVKEKDMQYKKLYDPDENWPYCKQEYLVLEGYEPIKKFEPHLGIGNGINFGIIGTATKMRDVAGRNLYVGDVVVVINAHRSSEIEKSFVVKPEDSNPFIVGFKSLCEEDGQINDEWIVVKEKSYKDLKHGELLDGIQAVLKEE